MVVSAAPAEENTGPCRSWTCTQQRTAITFRIRSFPCLVTIGAPSIDKTRRRGWGDEAGAENGGVSSGRVRNDAANRMGVAHAKTAESGDWAVFAVSLDGFVNTLEPQKSLTIFRISSRTSEIRVYTRAC